MNGSGQKDRGKEYWERQQKGRESLERVRNLVQWKLSGIYEGDPS